MRMPTIPPDIQRLYKEALDSPGVFLRILNASKEHISTDKYLHYDDLLHREPPTGWSRDEWWLALKHERRSNYKSVPLRDKKAASFQYCLPDPVSEQLHEIDMNLGGQIGKLGSRIASDEEQSRYLINSLIEEGITSSQLEGAAITRQNAKEMIRQERKPLDRSERMILNNFLTMKDIRSYKDKPLSKEIVFEIHRWITEDTLENPDWVGRFRRPDEDITVADPIYAEVFHRPPPAEQLEERMEAMCDFANGKTPVYFIHPAIRAIVLHFWLAYDHPFTDGNGRTARALFYWSMLNQGYWLFEYISISQIIRKGPTGYNRAFLLTETDDNDLTYFIRYHLDVITRAIKEFRLYIKRKQNQSRELTAQLGNVARLNHRQKALVRHALRHPNQTYTVRSHQMSHQVVYQTARTDLLTLVKLGLLNAQKQGNKGHYTPAKDIAENLRKL